MLRLYASRLDAQERAYVAALDDQPRRERLAAYVADRGMGNIVEETPAAGARPPLGPGGCPPEPGGRAEGLCPRCVGRPQLSVVGEVSEELLTPPRRLLCCRCG